MVPRHTIVLSLNLTFQDLHSGFSGRVSSKQSEQRQPAVVAPEPLYFEVSCGSVMFVNVCRNHSYFHNCVLLFFI